MDLAPVRTEYGGEDRRWLRDTHGMTDTIGVTLAGDAFPTSQFPNGTVPSGTVLAFDTALGLHVPYDNAYDADTVTAGQQANGRDVARGHLLDSVSISAGRRVSAAMLDHGAVLRNFLPTLPTAAGRLDAPAEADLPRIRYSNG